MNDNPNPLTRQTAAEIVQAASASGEFAYSFKEKSWLVRDGGSHVLDLSLVLRRLAAIAQSVWPHAIDEAALLLVLNHLQLRDSLWIDERGSHESSAKGHTPESERPRYLFSPVLGPPRD
jgi:hypothetical protein